MSEKEAKKLGLLPRLTSNERKAYRALTNFGALDNLEISKRASISKGRTKSAIERLIERGMVVPIDGDQSEEVRYVAVFPIQRFIELITTLIDSLKARKSELEATTEVVNNFTKTAIKNVRDASTEEREKRTERSEEDVKDLEIAMDASFSGMLASVEMDLKDLDRITKTANEFLAESSLRTNETCLNITRSLEPLSQKVSVELQSVFKNAEENLESSVDARVSDVIDFETNANRAFDEVLEAFKDSQDAFEDIIFTILDSGIADLEKVTKPINEQIEQAINSLKAAIQEASLTFQTEMVRVLNEQKRPMISTTESIAPKINRIISNSNESIKERLDRQHSSLSGLMENHYNLFSNVVEELASDFDKKVDQLVDKSIENTSLASQDMQKIEDEFKEDIVAISNEKNQLVRDTSATTQEMLNEMMEQFIIVLNRSVAQYQMDLGDLVAELESDFLNNVDNFGASVQNMVNFVNLALAEPVKTLLNNLEKLNIRIDKDEKEFLEKFDQTLEEDLRKISNDFSNESKKIEESLEKDFNRYKERLFKEIDNKHSSLREEISNKDKNLQNLFRDFVKKHQKELRDTSKDISTLTKKMERWRGENVKTIEQRVNARVESRLKELEISFENFEDKITSNEAFTKDGLKKLVRTTLEDVRKEFSDFGETVNKDASNIVDDVTNTIKKDSLSINNRLVQLRRYQDEIIEETRYPATQMFQEWEKEYKQFYSKIEGDFSKIIENAFGNFKNSRAEVENYLENTMDRKSSRTSREITSLKEVFERARENYVNKTKESFDEVEKSIAQDSSNLIDQERNTRESITRLTEKIVSKLSDGVNQTAEDLRKNLGDGSQRIFGKASSEISKQEIELRNYNDKQQDEAIDLLDEINDLHKKQLKLLDDKIEDLKDEQIGKVKEFREQFTGLLDDDLKKQLEILRNAKEDIVKLRDDLSKEASQAIDELINKTIQDLMTQTSGIEGAIFSTVGNITADAARKTESVVVIGEQAVLGIEERYTENLERIRQNLTDEVVSRIEEEAKNISDYKDKLRIIGRQHTKQYGESMEKIRDTIKIDLNNVEKATKKTISACENISCRFLEDLNEEITAMRDRVSLSTDVLIKDLLDDFERVLQKVKREATLFARKQFELSNKSNYEIAEAFLKSVDDLEEVMLKQIESFSTRTNMAIERTNEISAVINDHIKDMTTTFEELTQK